MAKTEGSMSALRRIGTFGAAVTVVVAPAAVFGISKAAADTMVPLREALRRCDFSSLGTAPVLSHPESGGGTAVIRTSGSTASAQARLVDPDEPGAHFDVGLIQEPRPSSATCGPGDPGTAYAGLDTDGAGTGMVTIQESIRQGSTGVWVIVERPNSTSQNPAEFYTSEFVAAI
jgi:hypothetical protein